MGEKTEWNGADFIGQLGLHMNDLLADLKEQRERSGALGLTLSHTLKNCAEAYHAIIAGEAMMIEAVTGEEGEDHG